MTKGHLFKTFTDDEFAVLINNLEHERLILKDDDTLINENDRAKHFYIVTEGRLKALRLYYNGNVNIISLFHEGDSICLDVVNTQLGIAPYDIRSIGKSEVLAIKHPLVYGNGITVALKNKLINAILMELSDENIKKLYKIDVLYRKSLRERIAVFLSYMYIKYNDRHFEIGMDRDEFAQYLGCNRSSLSHELSLMRQDGIIMFRKGTFDIIDTNKLMSIIV